MTTPPEQPSEAMIKAGVETYLKPPGGQARSHAELCRQIYLAMQRAATPASVQSDDTEWLRSLSSEMSLMPQVKNRLLAIAARLSTDTALVEALRSAPIPGLKEPMRAFRKRSDEWLNTTYRKALTARGGDNGKTA